MKEVELKRSCSNQVLQRQYLQTKMWQLFRIPISSRIPTLSFSFARVQNFTWPLIMPVGTFGVFKYYFQSRSCFTDFTELLFQKYPENLAIFPMVNLKFTGSIYSLYLCINVLLTKFSLQKTSSFPIQNDAISTCFSYH